MKLIKNGDRKIALKIGPHDIKGGLSFFSEDGDFIQVGGWKYNSGKRLHAHNHNCVERKIDRTQEFIFVIKGSLKAFIYDDYDKPLEELYLMANEGLICFSGGHGYEILDDDTVVIEVKNGPYHGAETDRRRLGD